VVGRPLLPPVEATATAWLAEDYILTLATMRPSKMELGWFNSECINYGTLASMALKRLPARFYRTASGREPVREWLKQLDVTDRRILGEDIKDVEFAWPLGLPLVRSLGRELWEVRSSLTGGKIARTIFCVSEGQMILLHGFIKKTQKTPPQDIDLALRRMKGDGR
jgi:phage-related protein